MRNRATPQPRAVLSDRALSPDDRLLEAWADATDFDVRQAIAKARRVLELRTADPDWRTRLDLPYRG